MIKGRLDGSTGSVYLYYHGPQRAIISDMSLPPRGSSEGVSTGLRIVLFPNEWTELYYSDIRTKWETGTSQLNMLESSGYLDIYTDAEEVKKVKEKLADFSVRIADRHGSYIKELEDKDIVKKYLESQEKKASAESEFKMAQPAAQKKYFELGTPLVGAESGQVAKEVENTTEQMSQMAALIEKQLEQSNKQAEQMTKMMETMQQVMIALASNLNKDK